MTDTVRIRVDLWKPSGKWAYGGWVNINSSIKLWSDEFKVEVVKNQDFVVTQAFKGEYYITTRDDDAHNNDPTYTHFYHQLFLPGSFSDAVNSIIRSLAIAQSSPDIRFDPVSGEELPFPRDITLYRRHHAAASGPSVWRFNPWTGEPRSAAEIGRDVTGVLLQPPS